MSETPDDNRRESDSTHFVAPADPAQSIVRGPDETVSRQGILPEVPLAFSTWNLEGFGPKTPLPTTKQNFPSFELVRLVAKGGCGEVWQARQKSLERIIAVKQIEESVRKETSASKIRRWRVENDFRMEAIATAQLDHPNILPIYDFGRDADGWPLIAMKLVKGDPWQQLLRRDYTSMPLHDYLARHLPIFVAVMQAVAFAHSRGIVHRDLKPAQVMVGEFGEVLLVDWGFAVYVGKEQQSSETGDELPTPLTASNPSGTPFFMAPEQTTINAQGISPLTDIYLLGGTLYYVLTNDFPHRAPTSEKAIEFAANGHIVPFTESAPDRDIPKELQQIALQALAANPADRIQSVTEFIERINNYLSGASNRRESQKLVQLANESLAKAMVATPGRRSQANYQYYVEGLSHLGRANGFWAANPEIPPLREKLFEQYTREALQNDDLILARTNLGFITNEKTRASLTQQLEARTHLLHRQAVQRRVAIALVGLLVAALIVGGAAYIRSQAIYQHRIANERDQAQDARARAERFQHEAETARADAVDQQKEAEQARAIAENEQYYANIALASSSLEQNRAEKAQDLLLNKTPAAFRNWEWGWLLAQAEGESVRFGRDGTAHASFSPDGSLVYTGDREGRLGIWSATTGKLISEKRIHNSRIWDIVLAPDGKNVYTASNDKTVTLSNIETGETIRRFVGHEDILHSIALSHDGKRLVTTSQDQTVRVWDTETGTALYTLNGFKEGSYAASFSNDDKHFVTASRDGAVVIWDTQTGEKVRSLVGQQESALSVFYNKDGTRILTAGTDRYARLYDANSGELLREFYNASAFIHSAVFNHREDIIASAADDGVGRLWDVATGKPIASFLSDAPMWKISFSSDDKSLVTCSAHSVRIWNVDRIIAKPHLQPVSPQSPDWKTPPDTIRIYGLSRGRDTVWREREKRWNVPEGRTLVRIMNHEIAIDSHFVAFAPDGSTRIDIDPQTYFGKISNARTGELIKQLPDRPLYSAIYSPDGKTVAVIQPIDNIEIFDTATWESRGLLRADPDRKTKVAIQLYIIASAAFTPDSKQLLVPYLNDHIILWDLATMKPVYTTEKFAGLGPCTTFTPNGEQFAIARNDDRISLWNTGDGKLIRTFIGHTRPVSEVSFSPDGQRLVSHARDGSAKLWEVKSGREIMTLFTVDKDDTILAAHFTKDGHGIYIATANGIVKFFDTYPWKVEEYPVIEGATFQERIEQWKRDHRLNPAAGE